MVVPVRVPYKITEAPGRGAPFPSFTTPLIVAVAVWAVTDWKNKKLVQMKMTIRIVVEEFLIIADSLIRHVTFLQQESVLLKIQFLLMCCYD